MERIRFTKKELKVIRQAMAMCAGSFDEHMLEGMTPEEGYKVYEKAYEKIVKLQKRKSK